VAQTSSAASGSPTATSSGQEPGGPAGPSCAYAAVSEAGASATATTSSAVWVTVPASRLSATEPTAEARLSPCRCRKRTLTAIPPQPAGSTWLANPAATCTANRRRNGTRTGTEPSWLTVPAVHSPRVPVAARASQVRSARATLSEPASSIARSCISSATIVTVTASASPLRTAVPGSRRRADPPRSGGASTTVDIRLLSCPPVTVRTQAPQGRNGRSAEG
jgi:hypothetical protein